MLNQQAPEKQVKSDGSHLAVNSIFHTIQGEGPFAGTPAVFVRLAGCNLQCPLCDTEYTNRLKMGIEDIIKYVYDCVPSYCNTTKLVVITGGEPFRQSIARFVDCLLEDHFIVQIETNGTLYQELSWNKSNLHVVCSPKTGTINKKLLPYISALKYVADTFSLENSTDGLPMYALDHPVKECLARPPENFRGPVYLQPVDSQSQFANKCNQDAVVASCLKYGYRLCLQIHKQIGVP